LPFTFSNPICPIIWLAVLVGNGYYYNRVFIKAVNQRVRKACEQEASDFRFDLHACEWIDSNEPNNAIQFIEKTSD
jgi:hypothetical protein